jgi:tRNA-intron endonuclease
MSAVNPFSSPSSSSPSSTNDFSFTVEGSLFKNGSVIIPDTRSQDQLRNKGYGEAEGSNYILRPYEVLHLIHSKRLKVFKNKKKEALDFDSALRLALKYDKEMLTKFLIYRDLRTRGYVAKEGFGFGADFRVYERGTFEKKVAKYVVFGINEGTNTKLSNFSKIISDIRIMGKEAIVAVVERRGEVIYYKLDKIKFTENKNTKNFLP